MALESINPTNGERIATYQDLEPAELTQILGDADAAFRDWRRTDFDARARLLRRASALLRERREELARLMALEMGKPLAQGRAEADKCAWVCEYYADNAAAFLAPEPVATDASRSFVSFTPLGTVLAVMPWNFPLWQVFRFAAPALMAGNAGLLKHSSNVCGCALAIEDIFHAAGIPEPLFRTLLIGSGRVKDVIAAPQVKAVTLTGSTPAGRAVAAQAGHALKKTVLELGGSDPYLVLEDADLELAAEACVTSRLINSGQSCIAAKRFIVEAPVAAAFTERLVAAMRALVVGDPLDRATQVGPLARPDLVDDLHGQVERSLAAGAQLLCGGVRPAGPGSFYPPTVLAGVTPGMPAFDEETFGPLAPVVLARDEGHAVELANRSRFGLGASIWTRDAARGERLARDIEAGAVFVNGIVKSDPRLPFGGIKRSGHGRELGAAGIREFVNLKTVWVHEA